jgi:CYTH domain-containing protein
MSPEILDLLRALLESSAPVHPDARELLVQLRDGAPIDDAVGARATVLAAALRERRRAEVETERKYLLRGMPPEARAGRSVTVAQGYVPGDRIGERLRHVTFDGGEQWIRTIKVGSGMSRYEVEEETTRAVFEAMWPLTLGRRVAKRRHYVEEGALLWEIDDFTDRELVLAEVELHDEHQHVPIPAWLEPWLVREVTGEGTYQNSRLAK